MKIRLSTVGPAALALLAVAGCAPTTPTFDRHFGESGRVLQAQQTRNPEAPVANRDRMADGMDGRAAKQALDRYQQSFGNPPRQTNVFTIGVGGGSDSGGER